MFFRKNHLILLLTFFLAFGPIFQARAFIGPSAGQSPGSGGGLFTVDVNRNIGYGSASGTPATKAESTSWGYVFTVASSTNPGFSLKNTTAGREWTWYAVNSGSFGLFDSGSSGNVRLTVDTSGKVGVATTTPAELLHVYGGNIKTSGSLLGTLSGAVVAGNVSSDVFGRLQGNGNFAFPASVGVATSSESGLPQTLSVYGNAHVTGFVRAGNGSASAPAFAFVSDTDTGIYTEGGATGVRVVVDSLDKARFKAGSSGIDFLTSDGSIKGWEMGDNYSWFRFKTLAGTEHFKVMDTSGVGQFIINIADSRFLIPNYKVGIGTAAPSAKLHIVSSTSGALINSEADIHIDDVDFTFLSLGSDNTGDQTGGIIFSDPGDTEAGSVRYNHANNTMSFRTSGTSNRMVIDSSGNVGIATTSPAYALHVYGTAAFSQPVIVGTPTTGTHAATKSYVDSAVTGGGGAGSFATLTVSGTSTFATTDGRVGIGTTGPGQKLDVAGAIKVTSNAVSELVSSGIFDYNAGGARIMSKGLDATTRGIFVLRVMESDEGNPINVFESQADGDVLLAQSTGNVGIGTTGPGAKLDVRSSIRIGADDGGLRDLVFFDTLTTPTKYNYQIAVQQADNVLTIRPSTVVGGTTFTTEGLTVNSSGNVGIGTTSPQQKLDVAGVGVFNSGNPGGGRGLWLDSSVASTHYSWMIGAQKNVGAALEITPSTATGGTTFTTPVAVFTQAGNVGIATTSPAYALHVYGTGAFSQPVIVGTPTANSHAATKNYVDSAVTGGGGAGSFATLTVSGTSTFATTDGRVGIGTTGPSSRLHVITGGSAPTGGFDSNAPLIVQTASHTGISIQTGGTTLNSFINFGDDGDSNIGQIIYEHANDALAFYTNTGERMRINSSGNVGIATTTPAQKLVVYGGTAGEGGVLIETTVQPSIGSLQIEQAGGGQTVRIRTKDSTESTYVSLGDGSNTLSIGLDRNAGGGIVTGSTGNAGVFSISGSNPLQFGTNNSVRMTIDGSGNVGIATTSPAYALHVYGTGAFSQPVIVGTPTANAHATTKSYVDSAITGGGGAGSFATLTVSGTSTFATATGTVGIGTANPVAPLQVQQIGNASLVFELGRDLGGVSQANQFRFRINNTDLEIYAKDRAGDILLGATTDDTAQTSNVFIGDTTNGDMTLGLTINQGANDNAILALKSSDVAHGITSSQETDTYLSIIKRDGDTGGVNLRGFSESSVGAAIYSNVTTAITTKALTSAGAIELAANQKSGTTTGPPDANANLLTIAAYDKTRFIFDAEGELHLIPNSGDNTVISPSASSYFMGGNVGIATTSPAYALHVYGTGAFSQPVIVGTPTANAHATTKSYVDSAITGGGGAGSFATLTVSGTSTFATTDGRVGIGTTGPGALLQVGDNLSATDNKVIKIAADNTTADPRMILSVNGVTDWSVGVDNSDSNKFKISGDSTVPGTNDRLTIDTSGNVGIGTTSPGSNNRLKVAGSNVALSANDGLVVIQSTDSMAIDKGGSIAFTGSFSGTSERTWATIAGRKENSTDSDQSGYLAFSTNPNSNQAERMRITSTGNVGIGTTVPYQNLAFSASAGNSIGFAQTTSGFTFSDASTGGLAKIAVGATGSGWNTSYIQFQTHADNTSALSNDMIIKAGNVGIATTSPAYALHVYGTGAFSQPVIVGTPTTGTHAATKSYVDSTVTGGGGDASFNTLTVSGTSTLATGSGRVGIGTTGPGARLHVVGPSGYTALFSDGTRVGGIYNHSNVTGGVSGVFFGTQTNDNAFFGVNGANYYIFVASSTGNVGIGTTGPGQKLDVAGAIKVTSAAVSELVSEGIFDYNAGGARIMSKGLDATTRGIFVLRVMESDEGNAINVLETQADGDVILAQTTGNVGIGTTGPSNLLHVSSVNSTAYNLLTIESAVPSIRFADSESAQAAFTIAADGSALYFGTNAYADRLATTNTATKMTIKSDGNVGIGTTAPNFANYGSARVTTVSGSSGGVVELGTTATDADGLYVGDLVWSSFNNTLPADKRIAYIRSETQGNTANNRGGKITFSTRASAGTLTDRLVIDNAGNVDFKSGNITAVNKLTVTTIDPLYQIGTSKYATYAASVVGGVKEEYVGKGKLGARALGSKNYEYVIDFSKVKEGSDLWVWRKTVDFSKDNVDALITPYGEAASIYYKIEGDKIIFGGDKPAEFSYRLIGKRFDWKKWPTYAVDQSEKPSFILK